MKIRSFLFASVPSSQLSFGFCPVVGFFSRTCWMCCIESRQEQILTVPYLRDLVFLLLLKESCVTRIRKRCMDVGWDHSWTSYTMIHFLHNICITPCLFFGGSGSCESKSSDSSNATPRVKLAGKKVWSWVLLGVRLIDEETKNPFKIRIVETSALVPTQKGQMSRRKIKALAYSDFDDFDVTHICVGFGNRHGYNQSL